MSAAALAALGLIAWASFAQAQALPTGSIIPNHAAELSQRNISEGDRARQTMNDYARCLIRRNPKGVEKALALDSGLEWIRALTNLAVEECLTEGTLQMPPSLLRGSLYRALYLRDYGNPPATSAPAALAAITDPIARFSHCVNSIDATNVRAFVMAEPATPAERQAIDALRPAMARCIHPGETIEFSPAVLQGAFAEAAYREAAAKGAPAP